MNPEGPRIEAAWRGCQEAVQVESSPTGVKLPVDVLEGVNMSVVSADEVPEVRLTVDPGE